MNALQRFDQQEVRRKPYGPTPIRIAAEKIGGGFRRLVSYGVALAFHGDFKRMIQMEFRERANAERGEKLLLIKDVAINSLELLPVGDSEQQPWALRRHTAHVHVLGRIRMVRQEPVHAALERRKARQILGIEGLDSE